ncbi:MAG: FtsK/SpoIIIE domain-containing protein [Bacillota bacterium]
MNMKIYAGKDIDGKDCFIDLEKDNLHTVILTGTTGSGKSIFHYSMYKQLIEQNSSDELGFVFMDMTQVDFAGWYSPYLYLPIILWTEQALNALELLAKESELRARGKSDNKRAIVIHIEECDMMALDSHRFEQAWLSIEKHKDKNNMYIVFSTSRPSPDVLTETILKNTDLKVVFVLSSVRDSTLILGKSLAEKFTIPGQKALAYNNKEVITYPFTNEYVEQLQEFDKKMIPSR